MAILRFNVLKKDVASKARLGLLETAHGTVETPVFMPVGTRASVKALTPAQLLEIDAHFIVANSYHLMLRPGVEVIEKGGGLHRFMNWPRLILTDSGGFQAFSLARLNKITDEGIFFQSHIDGSRHLLTPQESMKIQKKLGADIVMVLDETPFDALSYEQSQLACERTLRWAQMCRHCDLHAHQSLFAIVHGGTFVDLRQKAAQDLGQLPFEGFGLGGFAVGVPLEWVNTLIDAVEPLLPFDKPRYLMGFGTPRDMIEAVMRGVDLLDCVMPTRHGRHGTAFTWNGKVTIKAGRYAEDFTPLDERVQCYTSQFSKAYLRHLLNVNEVLGLTLISLHNLAFYLDFMRCLRQAIREETLHDFYQKICAIY